ncbi:MAG TPA: thiamine pyrophosphate-binding protein [Rhodopila sp.]|nr:thiamine pyrophosphate-binding protein [Rhodopila sp.]
MPDTPPPASIERPAGLPAASNTLFGSDAIAEALRDLRIPFIALNPGASYRGLHDSLVNHLGNDAPQMLLCLHEEHAVAIAQGWAKVTGTPMLVAVHSNVGLFHATMAIFNAWCDRMPVIVLGATGPMDAARRRPWIEWIHTAQDQGAIVRNYVKWDAQPASPAAAREALFRAAWIAGTAPMGPVYVNLDLGLQEDALTAPLPPLDPARLMPPVTAGAPESLLTEALGLLRAAERPVILMGRVSRDETAWTARVALAEALGARVVTDLKVGAAFPTDHHLHAGSPGVFPAQAALQAIAGADVILSLDWVDLGGALRTACDGAPAGRVIQVSLDHVLHNGWSMDHQALPPVDLFIAADPDQVAAAMLQRLEPAVTQPQAPLAPPDAPAAGPIVTPALAAALRLAAGDRTVSLTHLPLSWDAASWPFRHPLDYLGSDGGGGIGAGPGISVGAALALRGSGRLPVCVCGDGDFLMGATAIWTAAHYRIPLLIVVANNQSFFNDEVHQERVATMRNRPIENKWIGMRMTDPDIDLAALARAQGAEGFGPIHDAAELLAIFTAAIAAVEAGSVAVVDVRVRPGYTPAMASALTRTS